MAEPIEAASPPAPAAGPVGALIDAGGAPGEGRRFLESVVAAAGVLFAVLDHEGRFVRFNRACEQASGWRADEVLGRHPWDTVLPPEAAETIRSEAFARAMAAADLDVITHYENEWVHRNGSRRLLEWTNTRIADPVGGRRFMVSIGVDVTERRAAEARLARSEQQLRQAQAVAHIGSWVLDHVSGRLDWSDEVYRLFEVPAAGFQASYEGFLALIHPDDRSAVDAAYAGSLHTGEPYFVGHRLRMADGRIKWVEERGSTTFDAQRRPLLSIGTVQDVTERRLAEEALHASEERLRQAVRVADVGIFDHDLRTGAQVLSPEYRRIRGLVDGEVPSVAEFGLAVAPEDRERVLAAVRQCHNPGSSGDLNVEYRLVRPDGEVRWVDMRAVTFFEGEAESRRPVRTVGALVDITERKHTELRLRSINEELERRVRERTDELERQIGWHRLIIDAAIEGFCVVGPDARLVDVNPAYCRILGSTREELLTKRITDIDVEHGPQQVAERLERIRRTGFDRFDTRHRRADGAIVDVEISASWVQVGDETRFFAFVRDITERLRSHRELRAAKEEAERANHAKSEFLSRMSHELRTPMNAIMGFGQLLQMSGLPAGQADQLHEIVKAGRHLLGLIDEVLDLAAVEAGHVRLAPQPLDVAEVVRECVALVGPAAQAAGVAIEVLPMQERPMIGDRSRLKQVVLNLLSNAIKYNRPRGRVVVASHSPDPHSLELSVSDDGPGLTPVQIERLFQPFERLGRETSGVEGTGIGLSLCKRLVELMGGRIGVSSQPGEGCTFWVRLPAAAAPLPAARDETVPAATGCPGSTGGAADRVLYIEDNPANLRLMASIVERRGGIELLTATDAAAGIELARTRDPQLILLDIQLPGSDGYDVLSRVRACGVAVPVVAVTAYAMPADVDRGRAAGFADYLTKPLDIGRLLATLDRLLRTPSPSLRTR